jgi:hypothetical protein
VLREALQEVARRALHRERGATRRLQMAEHLGPGWRGTAMCLLSLKLSL